MDDQVNALIPIMLETILSQTSTEPDMLDDTSSQMEEELETSSEMNITDSDETSSEPPARSSPRSDASDESSRPLPYTPKELGAVFLEFYQFLTRLHFDPSELKVPPSGGWPHFQWHDETPGVDSLVKSDLALEVFRHLPYFESKKHVHYQSSAIDYRTFSPTTFRAQDVDEMVRGVCFENYEGRHIARDDIIMIAGGLDTGSRYIYLNVREGSITEDETGSGNCGNPRNVRLYLNDLKEAYRSLKLIPRNGTITLHRPEDVVEREEYTFDEEVLVQDEDWGTDLDVQYLRQVYRQHGWPDAFRREEADQVILDMCNAMRSIGRWVQYE